MLRRPPSREHLERLYYELHRHGAPSVGARRSWPYGEPSIEDACALAGEMLRYDPRLLTILVELFLERWRHIHPLQLRTRMTDMRWPQALCVVFSFAALARPEPELRYFLQYLSAGWPRVDPVERFFIDSALPGSRIAARTQGRVLAPYARWGFVGSERPQTNAYNGAPLGRYDARTRERIALSLAKARPAFTMAEYLAAIDHAVTRQQALDDLKGLRELRAVGKGRGARWKLKRTL